MWQRKRIDELEKSEHDLEIRLQLELKVRLNHMSVKFVRIMPRYYLTSDMCVLVYACGGR
jgi:hypothetical protein